MAAVSIAFEAPDNCGGAPVTGKSLSISIIWPVRRWATRILRSRCCNCSAAMRAALHEMAGAGDTGVKATAHRLKGAAQAVGAFDVSVAAAAVEAGGNESVAIAKLAAAIVEAENFILKLCR